MSIIKIILFTLVFALINSLVIAQSSSSIKRDIAKGTFEPNYESLNKYQTPEWFRDAKFGIWAHWGPQCEPEKGDWYAVNMYKGFYKDGKQGDVYLYHLKNYGHPSQFGFKDVINLWKAQNWKPDDLMKLYKAAGAKYFVAMANHHDNFDNWDSKFQPWNSVNMGPKKDLIAGWAAAARKEGLHFGVTVHAARAWSWYEITQGADTSGAFKGVPYDGKMTKDDGKGKWWEGYDPQDLYAQNHVLKAKPDQPYIDKFFNRTKDLIDKFHPDLLYFDDSNLPLGEAGLNIAAHYYNANKKWNNGKLEAVLNAKKMPESQRSSLVLDIERGGSDKLDPLPWQTDECIGQWHYNKGLKYREAGSIINMLIDIVSKNGNLLLSIPVRADGTIDSLEVNFLKKMGTWMKINGEGIYGTRPWKVFGETFTVIDKNDNRKNSFTAKDVRYTTKDGNLYLFLLGTPKSDISINTLGTSTGIASNIKSIQMLGSKEKIRWEQTADALAIVKPHGFPTDYAVAFKISF